MTTELSGRSFGPFVVLDKLGEGGFGTVYRARQALLDRPAVVKVLHPRLRSTPVLTERFLREARLASRLDHPYAAHIYAFGAEPDGTMWLAMELVRGTTLSQYLRSNGPLPLDRFIPLLERICEVLHTAHEAGIVHRDIKPDNVMVVARAGRLLPKLLDFGIAKAVLDEAEPFERTPTPTPMPMPIALDEPVGDSATLEVAPSWSSAPELTQRGAIMGSPHYMAPEQWLNAASVDRRSDLYALGVLAYEALTGSPPYTAKTLSELARAHAKGVVPPVPGSLPRALDAVFARALAPDTVARFDNALELAAAFRTAAGLADEPRPLPQLDDAIRQRFVADAPQPLAEAVAAIEAARNPRQARDAVWACTAALARYLGVLALAARSRFAAPRESPVALAPLRRIASELLTDADWIAIAHALVKSAEDRPDVHPIPELVMLFAPDDDQPSGVELFRQLAAARDELADAGAHDDVVRERLGKALVTLSALLRRAELVCDYALVVPFNDGLAERWVGVRRSPRPAQRVAGLAASAGPILVSRDGAQALALAPLVQVRAPAAGSEPELFTYAGRDERGAKLVAPPFEFHDDGVLDWLRMQMLESLDSDTERGVNDSSPYRGLEAFKAEDAAMFFGRERLVDAAVNRLRVQSLLAVVGASGAGKSSFVHAGIAPALGDQWRVITLRPGAAPLAALATRLTAAGIAVTAADEPARIAERLRTHSAADHPVLVVVDQFEELFTLCHDDAARVAFAAALAGAARDASDPVRVVLTLRDDFLVRAESLPALRERLAQGLQLLGLPAREDLERILLEPARRVGYDFEDDALVGRMVAEVLDQPGALALLSFTAAQLWERRDRHFRRLPTRAYEELGGVGGALARHADSLLDAMTREEQRLVREAFRNLVTSEGTRAVLSRQELSSVLGDTPAANAVIDRLVDSRLLVAGEGEVEQRIEIAHEALLAAWPRLVTWRREDAEGARLRDQLRAAARQWDERGRPRGLLWRDDALAEYQVWRQRYPGKLGSLETAFASASLGDAARGRRWRRGLLAAAFAVLAGGLVVLAQLNRSAERARARADDSAAEAHQRVLDLRVEQGRQALLAKDPMRALVYLSSAYSAGADGPALHFMISRAVADLETQERVLDHGARVLGLDLSPDDRLIASAGGTHARLWDTATGRLERTLEHTAKVRSVAFSPDGARVATAGDDHAARLWDTRSGELVRVFEHPDIIDSARFSPDGKLLATVARDNIARVWDVATGAPLATLAGHTDYIRDLAFRGDGERLVTWSVDNTARVWKLPAGEPVATLQHAAFVSDAQFSPDGSTIATASFDRTVKLWDGEGHLERVLKHVDQVTSVKFSPDGKRVVTASDDARAEIWDVASGDPVVKLIGHTEGVIGARFSRDGNRVLTYGTDASARLWDAHTGAELRRFDGHSERVWAGAMTADGDRVVTGSWDGTIGVWNAKAGQLLETTRGGRDELVAYAEGTGIPATMATGDRLLVASDAGTPKTRSLRDGSLVRTFLAPAVPAVRAVASPDGEHAVTLESGGARYRRAGEEASVMLATGTLEIAAFARDSRRVVVAGAGRSPEVWDVDPPRKVGVLDGALGAIALAFSPDGTRIALAPQAGGVALWDARGGAAVATLTGHSGHVVDIAWSVDGRQLITAGGEDKTARIWDRDGRTLVVLQGNSAAINGVAFDPTGALAATAGDDGVKIWSVASGAVLTVFPTEASAEWVGFSEDGHRLLAITADATRQQPPLYYAWSLREDRRSAPELAAWASCRIPLVFQDTRIVPAARSCK